MYSSLHKKNMADIEAQHIEHWWGTYHSNNAAALIISLLYFN